MDQATLPRIRTVALLGASGAGKTTLAEALLHRAGVISRPGRVEDGSTVSDAYKAPFEFTGKLVHVDFAVAGDLVDDADAKMRTIMAHQ